MAIQPCLPIRGRRLAAMTALALLATLQGAPSYAALPDALQCDESFEATLRISTEDLIARVTNHELPSDLLNRNALVTDDDELNSPFNLLAPRAAAAIREVFLDMPEFHELAAEELASKIHDTRLPALAIKAQMETIPESELKEQTDRITDDRSGNENRMNAQLPGVSNDDLSRYKKQMYRRDI